MCGQNVASRRLEFSPAMTQSNLANRVCTHGVSLDRAAIAKIENNLRKVSDFEVVALAKALETTVNDLLGIAE